MYQVIVFFENLRLADPASGTWTLRKMKSIQPLFMALFYRMAPFTAFTVPPQIYHCGLNSSNTYQTVFVKIDIMPSTSRTLHGAYPLLSVEKVTVIHSAF